jgi:hypothetical protein
VIEDSAPKICIITCSSNPSKKSQNCNHFGHLQSLESLPTSHFYKNDSPPDEASVAIISEDDHMTNNIVAVDLKSKDKDDELQFLQNQCKMEDTKMRKNERIGAAEDS